MKGFSDEILKKLRIKPSFDAETGEELTPVFAVLPETTDININTAPAEVLRSLDIKITDEIAQQIITRRDGNIQDGGDVTPFKTVTDFKTYLESISVKNINIESLSVATHYFLLNAKTTVGHTRMNLYSTLLRNDKGISTVIYRSLGVY
ncbi:MAG: general secretion pathway protein GspK [Gammaproteobacteria bacterium]|nr:general secretion pathway protein GspK [Gammaproteobacteria bacterium]